MIGDWKGKVGGKGMEENGAESMALETEMKQEKALTVSANPVYCLIAKRVFKHPKQCLYTLIAANKGVNRNQIAYIINARKWNSLDAITRTRPGVDCRTNHKIKQKNEANQFLHCDFEHIATFSRRTSENAEVLNLIDEFSRSLGNEIVKDECQNKLSKTKKQNYQ